ncbi:MAG: CoB--CoM heterodisulfide reductase iron-sulfur subunit B family protein, partial [Chloroflexota bacterium]
METIKLSYYPGCSLESTAKEYDDSVRATAKLLGIDLVDLPDWSCCGASSGHSTSHKLSLTLPARNLALAAKEQRDLAVACAACFLNLKRTDHELRSDSRLRQEVEQAIGMPLSAGVNVKHFLEVVARQVPAEDVRRLLKRPLTGLKVASYYGCYLVRPPDILQFDDPENPTLMDDFLRSLGAESVDWSGKVECCGGSLMLSRPDIAKKLVGEIARAAAEAGAGALVSACPLCQANLDTKQSGPSQLPAFYFTELAALALGADQRECRSWWKRHVVSPNRLLKSLNLL